MQSNRWRGVRLTTKPRDLWRSWTLIRKRKGKPYESNKTLSLSPNIFHLLLLILLFCFSDVSLDWVVVLSLLLLLLFSVTHSAIYRWQSFQFGGEDPSSTSSSASAKQVELSLLQLAEPSGEKLFDEHFTYDNTGHIMYDLIHHSFFFFLLLFFLFWLLPILFLFSHFQCDIYRWPMSEGFCSWILKNSELFHEKRCIELGSGTGIVIYLDAFAVIEITTFIETPYLCRVLSIVYTIKIYYLVHTSFSISL